MTSSPLVSSRSWETRHGWWITVLSLNLEVVGARKSRCARGRHACTEGTRVSPSRAPVLSWAHYFHAPATALNRFITKCDGQLLQIAKAFWLQSATWLIIATLTYLIHISHFRKRLSLPQPQGFTEKFANIRGLFLRRIRGTFEWYLHPTSTLIFDILVQSHRFLKAVRQLLITTRMLRPAPPCLFLLLVKVAFTHLHGHVFNSTRFPDALHSEND